MNPRVLFFLVASGFALTVRMGMADDPVLPGEGFAAARYETLWTKSPFSVATPDAASDSPDYALVGIAQFDHVSYANLIDKKTQEHFLLTSDQPVKGMTLVSIAQAHDKEVGSAVVRKDGQSLTLRIEQVTSPATPSPAVAGAPGQPHPPLANGFSQPASPAPVVKAPGFINSGHPREERPPPAPFRPNRIIRVPPHPSATPPPSVALPSPPPDHP